MNKRDAVFSIINNDSEPPYTPAAFFLHFPATMRFGQGAIDKHYEFFTTTGMDFMKIQFETEFPKLQQIKKPEDWANFPFYSLDFYKDQLDVVEGLVKRVKKEAPVILTLYSPFMCAILSTPDGISIEQHIQEAPDSFRKGIQTITDSLMGFVKEAIRLGVDGFYHSTQGGEQGRFESIDTFVECVRPYDLELMHEIERSCIFNILHVCDYTLPYSKLNQFVDYPGHIVNTNLKLTDQTLKPQQVADLFGRPFMGGLDRLGILAHGTPEQAKQAAIEVLKDAPERFILGADCTVPSDTPWENLKAAISAAHER